MMAGSVVKTSSVWKTVLRKRVEKLGGILDSVESTFECGGRKRWFVFGFYFLWRSFFIRVS